MSQTSVARQKIYRALSTITEKYHFAPLSEGPNGRMMPENLVFWTLTYLLNRNCLVMGEPGWGKTTGVKILASKLSGVPYDAFDSLEIRGNPQKYEEKIVARPHYGAMNKGKEDVVWQGTFGLPVLIVDEGNRLPYDSQDVILQGIDTGRWNYMNQSLFEGKPPTFITMNLRTGHTQNGFLPALKDRMDVVTEEQFWTTLDVPRYSEAAESVRSNLCNPDFVTRMLNALSKSYNDFKASFLSLPANDNSRLTKDERAAALEEIHGLDIYGKDNEPMLFLQAFMAEVNFSAQYGSKRSSDPISAHTHDKLYAGVNVQSSFSPRSAMAAVDYAKALAWFMGKREVELDHVRFVLPHVFAHKANFADDYRNSNGNGDRADAEDLHLAKVLVGEVHKRYSESVQPLKNLIARIQKGELSAKEAQKLDADKYDHPLMKDIIAQVKAPDKAFYEDDSEAGTAAA